MKKRNHLPCGYWTKEWVQAEALKYQTRSKFSQGCKAATTAAYRNGWIDEVCAHMKPCKQRHEPGYWTKERVAEEALKYQTKREFFSGSSSAYGVAYNNGWLDEVCAHMKKPCPAKFAFATKLLNNHNPAVGKQRFKIMNNNIFNRIAGIIDDFNCRTVMTRPACEDDPDSLCAAIVGPLNSFAATAFTLMREELTDAVKDITLSDGTTFDVQTLLLSCEGRGSSWYRQEVSDEDFFEEDGHKVIVSRDGDKVKTFALTIVPCKQ